MSIATHVEYSKRGQLCVMSKHSWHGVIGGLLTAGPDFSLAIGQQAALTISAITGVLTSGSSGSKLLPNSGCEGFDSFRAHQPLYFLLLVSAANTIATTP
jgi:hypothetical protein